MGIFESSNRYVQQNSNRRKSPIRLVEPSEGRVVEFEVTEPNEFVADIYVRQIKAYARALGNSVSQYNIIGRKIRIVFSDSRMAEIARQNWK